MRIPTALRWLNTVLAVCEYMSFAKSWQEKRCSSYTETWQVKNILMKVACEQALLFGQAKRASRERASEGPRKGELATISHKFSFPPRKPRDSAKRENCHRKRVAD